MQTYTHLVMGGAVSVVFYPDRPLLQMLFIFGSILPDLVMAGEYVLDTFSGNEPMKNQSSFTVASKEWLHSLPIMSLLFLLTFFTSDYQIYTVDQRALLGGILLHIVIDGLTHGKKYTGGADQTCMWPLHQNLPPLSDIIGLWEYRFGPGILRPKPFELGIDFCCLVFWIRHSPLF